jgi:hypothetical protein
VIGKLFQKPYEHRLLALKDIHQGKRGFIIGNGPSLRITDLDRLHHEITFASNKIYLAFDQTKWRPTYYTVLDVLVAHNNRQAIHALTLTKIFDKAVQPYFGQDKSIIWLSYRTPPTQHGDLLFDFSTDAFLGVYPGWSVVYEQLQLAFYMGIREIYLIGLDFKFVLSPSTKQQSLHGEILEHQEEINHFHPDYRQPGEQWTMPQLDKQYKAFICAKETFEKHGGVIYNASRQTALDVFEQVNFDTVVPAP